MNIISLEIHWVYIVEWKVFQDQRWVFLKIFNLDFFKSKWLETDFKESYFSISKKNVIRWMHFQTPPKDHEKIIYVSNGEIIDVILDIRKKSKTYWKYLKILLSSDKGKFLYIPKWCAHWFLSLEDNTIVNYMQTSCYSEESDAWIMYDSFWYDWESVVDPILSDRDLSFIKLEDFKSPFIF